MPAICVCPRRVVENDGEDIVVAYIRPKLRVELNQRLYYRRQAGHRRLQLQQRSRLGVVDRDVFVNNLQHLADGARDSHPTRAGLAGV